MPEDTKPRHESILEKMDSLVSEQIQKIQFNGEGGITTQQMGSMWMISSGNPSPMKEDPDSTTTDQNIPLQIVGSKCYVNIGPADGVIPTIDGDSIYGSSGIRPYLPITDSDIWVNIGLIPTDVFLYSIGPDQYVPGNLTVQSAQIITTGVDIGATRTEATITTSTGAVTSGTYPIWIGRIVSGELFVSYTFFQTTALYPGSLAFAEPGSGTSAQAMGNNLYDSYFSYTAAIYAPNTGSLSEAITFLP